jgi:hypothetical protein
MPIVIPGIDGFPSASSPNCYRLPVGIVIGIRPESLSASPRNRYRHRAEYAVSHTYSLTGKPDYAIRTPEGLIPIEVKSRACGPRGPYEGEVAQLVAYCLLVEDVLGEPVPYGVLQFADREVRVGFMEQRVN